MLDGSQISDSLATLHDRLPQLLPNSHDDRFTVAQCHSLAIFQIAQLFPGIQIPQKRLDHALQTAKFPVDSSVPLDPPTFESKLHDLLQSLADALREEPLVVSVLDGAAIKSLLEDEDDFAMLAENLFTELDVDDKGKLSPQKLRTALLQMGLEMGVPVPSAKPEANDLLSSILTKYESDGDQEIGQAQFAQLLQGVLEDLAQSLAEHPMAIVLDVKVNNGYQLRKLLENPENLSKLADHIFEEFDVTNNGKLDRTEACRFLESRGMEWGLPSKGSSELVRHLYDELFSFSDTDHSGELDKEEFRVLLQQIFESFSVQLEFNPTFTNEDQATH